MVRASPPIAYHHGSLLLLSVALVGFVRPDAHIDGQSLFTYDGLEEDGDGPG